jgi:hypothetical protein
MPSRRQRRLQKKGTIQRRFLQMARAVVRTSTPAPLAVTTEALPTKEPAILNEDIGKLIDIGVDPKTVDRLIKAGIRHVRELTRKGRGQIREIYGMKSRLQGLEDILQRYDVTLPA